MSLTAIGLPSHETPRSWTTGLHARKAWTSVFRMIAPCGLYQLGWASSRVTPRSVTVPWRRISGTICHW